MKPSHANWVALLLVLTAACGDRRLVVIPPTAPDPVTFRQCPIGSIEQERGRGTTNPRERREREAHDQIFDRVFGFIGSVDAYHVSIVRLNGQGASSYVDEARSYLAPEYPSDRFQPEDALTPLTREEAVYDFAAEYRDTTLNQGRAKQEVVYCLGNGSVWTQMFHLVRADGRWYIIRIEPAIRVESDDATRSKP